MTSTTRGSRTVPQSLAGAPEAVLGLANAADSLGQCEGPGLRASKASDAGPLRYAEGCPTDLRAVPDAQKKRVQADHENILVTTSGACALRGAFGQHEPTKPGVMVPVTTSRLKKPEATCLWGMLHDTFCITIIQREQLAPLDLAASAFIEGNKKPSLDAKILDQGCASSLYSSPDNGR